MIYTGLNRTGEIEQVYAHGGSEVSAVYGSIGEAEPIYYKPQTIAGTSPLTFKGLGQPLTDYTILGNSYQDGTPSPDMPVDVIGVGEKTENLFDKNACYPRTDVYLNQYGGIVSLSGTNLWTISDYIWLERGNYYAYGLSAGGSGTYCCVYNPDKTFAWSVLNVANAPTAITINSGGYVRLSVRMINNEINSAMLVPGTFAPQSYIPYGYKIPITCGGVTQNIYLDEPLRKQLNGDSADALNYATQTLTRRVDASCDPLVTPTTESATLPQIQTISGANTLSVGTTVQPSAISITGNIKPIGYGRPLDVNDVDIQDKNNEPIFIHE